MLSGQGGIGESMFPNMTAGPTRDPTPEEMEKAMEAVKYDKVVRLKKLNIKTYHLWDEEDTQQYVADRLAIMQGMQRNDMALLSADRQFVEDVPGYIAHMEWVEFDLEVGAVKPVDGAEQGDGHG